MLLTRHILTLLQQSVDPVADAQALLEGLDVNIRRLALHRFGDDAIDDTHDRRLARQIAQALDVIDRIEIGRKGCVFDQVTCHVGLAEKAIESALDVGGNADFDLDRLFRKKPKRMNGVVIPWIGDGDLECRFGFIKRHDARGFEKARAQALAAHRQIRIVGCHGKRQAQCFGKSFGHILLGNHAELGQEQMQWFRARLFGPLGALQTDGIELALFDQELAKLFIERLIPADRS